MKKLEHGPNRDATCWGRDDFSAHSTLNAIDDSCYCTSYEAIFVQYKSASNIFKLRKSSTKNHSCSKIQTATERDPRASHLFWNMRQKTTPLIFHRDISRQRSCCKVPKPWKHFSLKAKPFLIKSILSKLNILPVFLLIHLNDLECQYTVLEVWKGIRRLPNVDYFSISKCFHDFDHVQHHLAA